MKKCLKKIRNNSGGYTIFELLIYIALIGSVVSAMVLFSLSVSEARNKNYVAQEVQANGRMAMDVIAQRIRASNGVDTGNSTFDSDPGVLDLDMADSGVNPTVIDLTADDGRLRITEGVAAAVNLTSDEVKVTNLVFTDLTSGNRENIRVQMTIEYNNTSGDVEFDYSKSWQTTVSLRQ